MGRLFCERCGQPVSPDDSLVIGEKLLCRRCAEASMSREGHVPASDGVRTDALTACVNCGKVLEAAQAAQLLSQPMCQSCLAFFRNRPFPGWIKASFVCLVAIVVFTLLWNSRFMFAYVELRQMSKALLVADLDRAAELAASAADRVPERRELRCLADYNRAIVFLRDDKCQEALAKLLACRDGLPPEAQVERLIVQARIGVAFNDGDYDEFLRAAQELLETQPNDPIVLGNVASAYACKYAQTGREPFRQKSLEFLNKARALDQSPEFREYETRIRHRLHTREIITADQFHKRYPDGWKP